MKFIIISALLALSISILFITSLSGLSSESIEIKQDKFFSQDFNQKKLY